MSDSDANGQDPFDPLSDPYPEEFEFLHIGTAINADTNQLLVGAEAFDTQLLKLAGLLDRGPGKSVTDVYGDGTSTESQDAWAWSVSGSLTLNAGIIDASAKFYIQQSLNACRRSSQMKVFARRINSTTTTLKKGTRQQLLDCRTKLFAEKMDNVLNAAKTFNESDPASVSALVGALTDFYDTFGTGYVDKIDETAVGIFEGTLKGGSTLTEDTFGIGGGVSVSLPLVSAGIAADYLKKLKNATAATDFTVRVAGRPVGCAPLGWAEEKADLFAKNGIEQCTNPKVWEAVFEKPPVSEVPDHAPKDLPSVAGVPEMFRAAEPASATEGVKTDQIRDAINAAIKKIQYERLDPETKKKYPDHKQALEAELDELKRQATLNEEDFNNAARPLTEEQINDKAAQPLRSNPAPPPPGPTAGFLLNVAAAPSAGAAVEGAPNPPSGYTPRNYIYRPWSYRFPELGDISKMCTTAQVVFGQSLVWFSIRAVFAQYLDYCAQFKDMCGPDDPDIAASANQFRDALNKVSEFLTNSLKKTETKKDLFFLRRLEGRLKRELDDIDNDGDNPFTMYDHYLFWIDNYAWLKRIPFGVVAIAEHDGQYYYQKNPYPDCPILSGERGFTETKDVSPSRLVGCNAYRLYPIISTDYEGKPYFVWVGAPSRLRDGFEDANLRFCEKLTLTDFLPWQVPHGDFDETTLPALIHQSAENFQTIANAEDDPHLTPYLQERWNNRQAMWGMNLYPGFDTATGPEDSKLQRYPLLKEAARVAKEASHYGTVLPDSDETGKYKSPWRLREPAGKTAPKAAYFHKYEAMFFWGPGPEGWHLFEPYDIRLVPINYDAVRYANGVEPGGNSPYGVKSGGGPMWKEPRTDELRQKLKDLATGGKDASHRDT